MKQKLCLVFLLFIFLLSSCVKESPEPIVEVPRETLTRELVHTQKNGDLTVWLYSDLTAEIASVEPNPATKHLAVPEKIEEYTVVAIRDEVFASSPCVEITLPDTIVTIGKGAFRKSLLEHITLPASLTFLGEEAFENCLALEKVTFSSPLKEIPLSCFFSCHSLKEVILKEGTARIGEEAFGDCTELQYVSLPASLTDISPFAFWNCRHPALSLTLPDAVRSIGESAFAGTVYENDPAFAPRGAEEAL